MPEVVSCPKCQRKSRVPDGLVGKRVKCPGCGEVFTAAVGAAAPPPRPQRKADEDDAAAYEVVDERKRRRGEDEDADDEDDHVADRPHSRRGRDDDEDEDDRPRRSRGRDDDEDEDDDRGSRRRRRYSRDDDEDEEDEGPPKAALGADWSRVRLGFSLLLSSVLTLIGAFLVSFLGMCCVMGGAFGAAANAGRQGGPPQAPDFGRISAGFVIVVVLALVVRLAAHLMMIVGSVLCLASPRGYRARTLALVTLILAGSAIGLGLTQQAVSVGANGVAGLAGGAGGNPFAGAPGAAPLAGGAAVAIMVIGGLGSLAGVASYFTFGFYVRAVGQCLRDYSLAGTARGWLITLGITAGLGVLGIVAAVAVLGAAIWTMARGGGMGPQGQPGAGPGAALGGGLVAVAGVWCLIGVLALVLLVWYIILLAQARSAIGLRMGRRRY